MKLLSQMFTTLRNGQLARKQIVLVPYSNFCWNILNVLLVHGYIQGIQKSNQTILQGCQKAEPQGYALDAKGKNIERGFKK